MVVIGQESFHLVLELYVVRLRWGASNPSLPDQE